MAQETVEISRKEFRRFKKEFRRWQRRLGLTDWRVDFYFCPLEDEYAHIIPSLEGRVAACTLSSQMQARDYQHFNPERVAKHEALHLATFRLYWLGGARHVRAIDLEEEWESLVRRLEAAL